MRMATGVLEYSSDIVPDNVIKKKKWDDEQENLRKKLILDDCEDWQTERHCRYVAGLDISYPIGKDDTACAGLVVLDTTTDDFSVVYEDISMVEINQPYMSGYLAFREAPILADKLFKLKDIRPEVYYN
jgi:deoxyinosine 3'endonuclease (endonuclease V)